MGAQTRMSVQKRERERKKAEKAAMKRERRQQRKDIDPQAIVAEAVIDPNVFAADHPAPIPSEPVAPGRSDIL